MDGLVAQQPAFIRIEIGRKVGLGKAVRVAVLDTQAAAHIDVPDGDAFAFQTLGELVDAATQRGKVVQVQDL